MNCLPAYATAGLFSAAIILDLINQRDDLAKSHLFLGVLAFLLVQYLCQSNKEFIAWALLTVPFILIMSGFFFASSSSKATPSGPTPFVPPCTRGRGSCSCPYCRRNPEPVDPSCPAPEPIIPAKKECSSCTKG
jgi:hypothetical protein